MGWLLPTIGANTLLNYLTSDEKTSDEMMSDSSNDWYELKRRIEEGYVIDSPYRRSLVAIKPDKYKSSEDFMQDIINYKPKPFTGKYSGETYNPVSYADSTFYSFLDELNYEDGLHENLNPFREHKIEANPDPIYSDDEIAKDIRALWLAAGAPVISQKGPFELAGEGERFNKPWMLPGYKSMATEGTDYQRELDELYIRHGDLNHLIAEISHSLDFNVSLDERKDLLDRGMEEAKKDEFNKAHGGTGEERYHEEGKIEHHAHQVTEVEILNDLINKGFTEDKLWRNINPYSWPEYRERMKSIVK